MRNNRGRLLSFVAIVLPISTAAGRPDDEVPATTTVAVSPLAADEISPTQDRSGRTIADQVDWFDRLREASPKSLTLSPNGQFLAFGRRPYGSGANQYLQDLQVLDLKSGSTRIVAAKIFGRGTLQPTWSPDSRFLAYVGISDSQQRVHIWDRQSGTVIFSSADPVPIAFSGIEPKATPTWTRDGKYILYLADMEEVGSRWIEVTGLGTLGIRQVKAARGVIQSPTRVSSFATPSLEMDVAKSPAWARGVGSAIDMSRWKKLVAVDIASGLTRTVAYGRDLNAFLYAGNEKVLVSRYADLNSSAPDSVLQLADIDFRTPEPKIAPTFESPSVRSENGAELPILIPALPFISLGGLRVSPDTGVIAYPAADTRGATNVLSIATGGLQQIPWPNSDSTPSSSRSSIPLWAKKEDKLYILHLATQSGEAFPRILGISTVSLGLGAEATEYVPLRSQPKLVELAGCGAFDYPCAQDNGDVTVKASTADGATIITINAVTGSVSETPILKKRDENKAYSSDFTVNSHIDGNVIASSGQIFFERRSAQSPPDIIRFELSKRYSSPHVLKVVNEDRAIHRTRRVPIRWKNTSGEELTSWLYLPESASAENPPPVIAVVYPYGSRSDVHAPRPNEFDGGGPSDFDGLRSLGGFAVLYVDIPLLDAGKLRRPEILGSVCNDISRNVETAVTSALATKIVDTNKVGLMGFSYGGYLTNCIITRSSLFRAAVSGSGISDWGSLYGSLGGSGFAKIPGNSPWENPKEYVEESPIYHLNRIKTPLLLFYGKNEPLTADQTVEFYNGIQNSGGKAVLIAYDDSDHGAMFDMKDFWSRVNDWFGYWFNTKR